MLHGIECMLQQVALGEYLLSKMDYIVNEANKLNDSEESPDIPAGESYTVTITTDVLRIRAGAGTNYEQVGSVKRGEVYTIVETQGNWGKLKSGAGWICLDYTSRGNEPTTTSKYPLGKYVVNTPKGLNVRKSPVNGAIIKVYSNGTRFDTYEIKDNWARTPSGWVCLDYCKLVNKY